MPLPMDDLERCLHKRWSKYLLEENIEKKNEQWQLIDAYTRWKGDIFAVLYDKIWQISSRVASAISVKY